MRGRIIHYDATTGTGRIAAGGRQFSFEIGVWESDTAPEVNQVVSMGMEGDALTSVERVPDEVLLRERTADLAGRVGSAGAAALGHLRELGSSATARAGVARPGEGTSSGTRHAGTTADLRGDPFSSFVSGLTTRLGVGILASWGVFVAGGLFFPFVRVPWGLGTRSFTLAGLSDIHQGARELGIELIGTNLFWPAALALVVPLLIRSRWAWLALALPLVAVLKPAVELVLTFREVVSATQEFFGLFGMETANARLRPSFRIGFWTSLISAGFLLLGGLMRVVRPPRDQR